jgi:hypothetical protein
MIGLMFLAAIAMCFVSILWLSNALGNLVRNTAYRGIVKVIIFIALLASPFIDELIGKYQFESLCRANGIESADVSKARGKIVKVEYGERSFVEGTIIPIKQSDVFFRNAETGEIVIQHKNYYAFGGWLMRYTPISLGSNQPFLFSGSTCSMLIKQEIFKNNSITLLYK